MFALRAFVISVAALTAVFTFGFRAAGQVAQGDPAAQFQLATDFFESARYGDALVAYDLALRGDDAALGTRARKGKVRSALRIAEFELARAEAETLNSGEAPDAEARTLLGDALWANGLFDEAETAYEDALAQAPGSSRAGFGRARSLASRSRLEEALDAALTTAAMAPQDAEVQALVGQTYERLHRFEESADAYERYITLLPMVENSATVAFAQAKVDLLRSFEGKVPMEVVGDPDRVHRISFRLSNNKVMLQGRVNNRRIEWVLDTGSEHTGLTGMTAQRSRVRAVTSSITAGVGANGLRRLVLGRVDDLEVGSLRVRNVPVAIGPLERGFLPRGQTESFSPLSLGFSAVVDYEQREVLLSRALPDGEADFRLSMRMNRLPMVRGLLNSTHPAYFVVDTGGEVISISAETALALAMPPVRRIPLRVYGLSGIDESAFLLPGVDLNFEEIEYRKVGLAVLNLRAPSVLLGFQLGGIVGYSFLSKYRVSLDLERSELRLEKS